MSNRSGMGDESVKVSVVGAGAWGTTLARHSALGGHATALVARTEDHVREIVGTRENRRYLPGVGLPPEVDVTADLARGVEGASVVLLVVPSPEIRRVSSSLRPLLKEDQAVVSCAKGLESGSLLRLSEVIEDASGVDSSQICALSGPNLSAEIAAGMPASAVVASRSAASAAVVQTVLSTGTFRVYTSSDIVGVEYGGALKNVIAIGAGVADGLGLGQNAKAAFITRGLAEISRIGVAAGANALTFGGLSGLGDLIATCESSLSRNRSFGERLGRGMTPAEAAAVEHHVIEGIGTARATVMLADRFGIEAPIATVVCRVIDGDINVYQAIDSLLARASKPELDVSR